MNKVCETGPPVYRPYPRRLESLIICRCHYKDSTFSSVIFKTLSVGPARIRTRDLPQTGQRILEERFFRENTSKRKCRS